MHNPYSQTLVIENRGGTLLWYVKSNNFCVLLLIKTRHQSTQSWWNIFNSLWQNKKTILSSNTGLKTKRTKIRTTAKFGVLMNIFTFILEMVFQSNIMHAGAGIMLFNRGKECYAWMLLCIWLIKSCMTRGIYNFLNLIRNILRIL